MVLYSGEIKNRRSVFPRRYYLVSKCRSGNGYNLRNGLPARCIKIYDNYMLGQSCQISGRYTKNRAIDSGLRRKTHNVGDVNAHQIEGSALYMHRLNEELDHKFNSIDPRYFTANKLQISTNFESLDAWYEYGHNADCIGIGALISTNDATDSETRLTLPPNAMAEALNWTKNPRMQVAIKSYDTTNLLLFIGLGPNYGYIGNDYVSFRYTGGKLYASWESSDTLHNHEIAGIDITEQHIYRIEIDSTNSKITWIIDEVIVHEDTDYFPTGTPGAYVQFYIKTEADQEQIAAISNLTFTQDA